MTASRRDLLIGAACLMGAASAYAVTPRRRVSLLQTGDLASVVPASFGAWTGREVTDLVAPKTPGGLIDRLYNQTLERLYVDSVTGQEVMMLLAHGDTQTNELQLHRPEVCYPAFGFEIVRSAPTVITLAGGADLPARQLVAVAASRRENIVYWTRLGEFLPTSEAEQRLDRARTALKGLIADGLLARFSIIGGDSDAALAAAGGFIAGFLGAVRPDARAALIGGNLAARMNGGARRFA
jgi:EpsI family protein